MDGQIDIFYVLGEMPIWGFNLNFALIIYIYI